MQRKYKILVTGVLISFISYFTFNLLKLEVVGAKEFVLKSDKDNMYENILIVKKYKNQREFENMISFLLSSRNIDLLSKQMAIQYVKESQRKDYINQLKKIKIEFNEIPIDSVWNYEVSTRKYRSNNL